MEHDKKLDSWLAAARADLSERGPDELTEQQLLSRVREVRALQSVAAARISVPARDERRIEGRQRWLGWRVASAMTLVVAVVAALVIYASQVTQVSGTPTTTATSYTPFLALVASDAMAAERSAMIVPSQVSGAALADYGLPLDPARVDQPIRAEFLVSPSGLVLAVRFAE